MYRGTQEQHDALAAVMREYAEKADMLHSAAPYVNSAARGFYRKGTLMRPAFMEVTIGMTDAQFDAARLLIYGDE